MTARFSFRTNVLLGLLLCAGSSAPARGDSIFTTEFTVAIIGDKKATTVGDILTVVVQESNTATKDSSTQTSKKTALDASISSFLYSPNASTLLGKHNLSGAGRSLPALKMASANDFDGSGKINNSESIIARFGVRVVDVLPNGNLIVEGLRHTSFANESRVVVLRGTVRPEDISPGNTVLSYSLADVSITFKDSGALGNAQKKGWFSRVWDVLTPF